MLGAVGIIRAAKGLALVLALYVAYDIGGDRVRLSIANTNLIEAKHNEETYKTVYSKSDAAVLDGLRQYQRD